MMQISLETLKAFRMILIGRIAEQRRTNVTEIFLNTGLSNMIKIVFSWCCSTLISFNDHSFVKSFDNLVQGLIIPDREKFSLKTKKNVPEPKNSRIIFCYIKIVNKISGSFSTVDNCELAVF